MTTVQIVGIVVAAAIVLLLIIALLVTRRRGSASKGPAAVTSHASFLAAATQEPEGNALGLDWGPSGDTPAATTTTQSPVTESGASAAAPEPARPAEGGSAASEEAAPESGPGGHRVPLSDIIVTTSNKMVDLQDPEVRRMLTDLVKYEIDQATHYRQQGQTIDAVLQLTEAEKISRALDMHESAAAIRKMMEAVSYTHLRAHET